MTNLFDRLREGLQVVSALVSALLAQSISSIVDDRGVQENSDGDADIPMGDALAAMRSSIYALLRLCWTAGIPEGSVDEPRE